ncbi:MAG: anti-sigma factor [Lachnospiraceae bacterium]|nr:anti-sigma factor [Lachnospiraceae bacterium]
MNKNTIDAYHKITAPEGLQERIEARIRAEQAATAARRSPWWKGVWVPAATAFAAAAICLAVWAGGAGTGRQDGENRMAEMRLGDSPSVQLMSERGEVLGSSQTVLDVYSGETADLNVMLVSARGVAPAEADPFGQETDGSGQKDSAKRSGVRAAVFQVTVTEPVTFRTDSESLSVYDVNEMLWTELCSELILETDGELCVLLSPMGDGEVFYIEMSSAEGQSEIQIVYDETAGRYLASCQEITGE